jgi:hypothetical protein
MYFKHGIKEIPERAFRKEQTEERSTVGDIFKYISRSHSIILLSYYETPILAMSVIIHFCN